MKMNGNIYDKRYTFEYKIKHFLMRLEYKRNRKIIKAASKAAAKLSKKFKSKEEQS